jgi:uncharacterized protein (UPF0276 family)
MTNSSISGAGLGLRRGFLDEFAALPAAPVDFLEIAPENWIGIGGPLGRKLQALTERYTFICHGLSLSIGSPASLDKNFLQHLKQFLDQHHIRLYSEHLSHCSDDGHLYDLMPIPFTEEAVHYVAARIRRVQEILERRLVIENVSYYAVPGQQLKEIEFIKAILEEADCNLLLDVNNIYVNSVNHGYDAEEFLHALPRDRIAYLHVAGHYQQTPDLIIDTHGAKVIAPVWELLNKTYARFGIFPTLLERDFNLPSLEELFQEIALIQKIQQRWSSTPDAYRQTA